MRPSTGGVPAGIPLASIQSARAVIVTLVPVTPIRLNWEKTTVRSLIVFIYKIKSKNGGAGRGLMMHDDKYVQAWFRHYQAHHQHYQAPHQAPISPFM